MENKLSLLLDDEDDLLVLNNLTDSSSSSEDEQELLNATATLYSTVKRSRVTIRDYYEEVVPTYSDDTFQMHFRLTRNKTNYITKRFNLSEEYQKLLKGTSRACISAGKHVLVFLWFAGHQTASFRDVADRFDLSLSSLHEIISRVSNFLVSIKEEVIKLPGLEDKDRSKNYYRLKGGLPNTIGSIDGSHIKIDTPSERKIDYFNRKGFYSVVLQAVCDEQCRFLDVFVGFPGSVHDARVFRNSQFFNNINSICRNGDYILGDSAYPLLPSLITPYRDNGHLSAAQKKFNKSLSSCRVDIEHSFGLLKQRFRQLYHLKLRSMRRICYFIMSCCVLHNMTLGDGLSFDEDDNFPDEQPETVAVIHENANDRSKAGHKVRDELCNSIFNKCTLN